jgi:hypothetical protein
MEAFFRIPAENGHLSGQQMANLLGRTDPQFSVQKNVANFNLNANIETEKRAMVRLNGMAKLGTEGGVQEFLGIKDFGAYGIKDPNDVIKLQNEQFMLSKNPQTDPRVSSAVSLAREYYGQKMQDLGIYKRDPKSATKRADFDSFVGLLQQGLVKWHDDNGKNPDNKTIVDEILPQTLHTHAVERLGGWWSSSQEPVYHGYVKPMPEDVPKSFADDHYNEAIKRGGSPPTQMQIYNAYLRTQYDKIMELEKGKSGGAIIGGSVPTR